VAYESYFDYDGNAQQDAITDGRFPRSLSAFINDFRASSTPSSTTTTTPLTTTTSPSPPPTTTTAPPTTTTSTSPPTTTTTSPSSGGSLVPDAPASLGVPTDIALDDEFNTGSLNTSLWAPSWFGNQSQQNGTVMSASNVSVGASGLALQLTANATGGIVSSNPDDNQPGHTGFQVAPTAGDPVYVEFQATLPASANGQIANWPALWLDGQTWPEDGEIDVMEGLGGYAAFHLHYGTGGGTSQGGAANDLSGTHTYGVLWTTSGFTYIYDGAVVGTINVSLTSPMYLVMENSSGSGPTVLPATMDVRYVRVWH
jgi:hypothetical protein